jgi:hypothetical protein
MNAFTHPTRMVWLIGRSANPTSVPWSPTATDPYSWEAAIEGPPWSLVPGRQLAGLVLCLVANAAQRAGGQVVPSSQGARSSAGQQ